MSKFELYKNFVFSKIDDIKIKDELNYAIKWMELHVAALDIDVSKLHEHPCVGFSSVIDVLLNTWTKDENVRSILINWLCDNKKCPFGMLLKVKAFKSIKKNLGLLSIGDVQQLQGLLARSNQMEYRPREILYLEKILKLYDSEELVHSDKLT